MICDMKLAILALDGVFDTGLTVLLDTFTLANELSAAQGFKSPPFDVSLVGVRQRVRTALGFSKTMEPVSSVLRADWVIVPALNAKTPDLLLGALERRDVREAIAFLRTRHADGSSIAAACIGTFLLAETGLLDHREATTSWTLAPLFRQRYPTVHLDDSRIIVAAERVVTAGAMMGHLDLALWIVRQASPELATLVARLMLADRRASQAQYVIPDHIAHADPLISRFDRWAREHLSEGFSLQNAASALAVHTRTLQRRTEAVLGKSPLAFFQDLRVQHAQQLVAAGCDLETVASEVGYADSATLRALLRRKLGRGVRELRAE
jgi:transcriptional regulator GlxA family with amidase domain